MKSGHVIADTEALERWVNEARAEGLAIALANGIFDILHVGHLRYLEEARSTADTLIVAINSDRSTRQLKGPDRPITPELERAELIAGIHCVDAVTVFDDETVERLLRTIRPSVHCKGTDYTAETVPEAQVAHELGIRVAICGDEKRHSTREIIRRMRDD